MSDLPALVFHEQEEVAQVVGVLDGVPQVRLQHGAEGGLSPGLPEPLRITDRPGPLALQDNGQAVFPAQAVRDGPDLPVVALRAAVVFLSGLRVHRVEQDVGVDVGLVHMDADDGLVAGQVFLHQCPGDLQCQFRGYLPRAEGLDHVVILHAALLAVLRLGLHHLLQLPARVTAVMGGEDLLLGLVPVEDIADAHIQPPLPGQDLGDGHYFFATSYISS